MMKTNRWIASSRHVYACLLYLYPAMHRAEYGDAMLQLFHDQCRAAYSRHGLLGMFTLWLRTFFDLGISAISEHFSAPGAKWGLLEAMPNKPVPWKGVVLVLIPGLIFFAIQIGQLNDDHQLWLYQALIKWTPYALMLPVVFTWGITRRYPIWGLIPLGLLFSNLMDRMAERIGMLTQTVSFDGQPQSFFLPLVKDFYNQLVYRGGTVWLIAVCLFFLALFMWIQQRRKQLSRAIWVWLALYLLLSAAQISLNSYNPLGLGTSIVPMMSANAYMMSSSSVTRQIFAQHTQFWTFFDSGTLLLLIFAGRLLARRYGDLAILLPLGYLLDKVVYGVYLTDFGETILYMVVGVVLLYRVMIALVVPVWVSRSTGVGRSWALAVPIVLAFAGRIVLNQVTMGYFYSDTTLNLTLSPLLIRLALVVNPLVTAVALALAIALYRCVLPTPAQNAASLQVVKTAHE